MTIKQLMDGIKVNWIHVNIIEEVTLTKYIVGDASGLALMEIPEVFNKCMEVGKGVKLVKPSKIIDNVIACDKRFNPMKTKAMKLDTPDQDKIDQLKNLRIPTVQLNDDIKFKTIENDIENNATISKILVYVTTVSRPIESKYGCYRICNLRDTSSDSMAVNLYAPHVDKLEANEVHVIKKLKKITMKTDQSIRLTTTKYSQIEKGSQEEKDLFQNVQIADKMVQGCCIMFTNMSSYYACSKHLSKLDQYMTCMGCEKTIKVEDAIVDFHCMLQIEDNEDSTVKSILVFKRLLNVDLKTSGEEEIEERMDECIVGKIIKVDYNTRYEDDDVAVKVTVID